MLSFADALTDCAIYENEELSIFFRNLEKKYNVTEEIELFQNLVNFSKNSDVPLHNWFKYREGYSNKLVEELLRRYPLSVDEFVIDPFCGSGTTLVEAGAGNRSSMGIDANPMSVVISNAKAQIYSNEDIVKANKYLDDFSNSEILEEDLSDFEDVKSYFKIGNLKGLIYIKKFIEGKIRNKKIKNLFMAGFLSIIEECSERKRDGNGLKKQPSKVTNVISHFILKMTGLISDITNSYVLSEGEAFWGSATAMKEIVEGYSRAINKKPGSIIFSPPYANSFDYFESYKIELRLGGFIDKLGKEGLSIFRDIAVRSFVSGGNDQIEADKYVQMLADEVAHAIPIKENKTGKKDLRTRKVPKMLKGYFTDMDCVLQACSDILTPGGYCGIVVDQSSYLGKIIPTDLLLAYFGEQHGFEVKNIIVCRRAKTSSQQMNAFPYLKECLRESIVVLQRK